MKYSKFFQSKKILLVDDCPMIVSATRTMLINNGCDSQHIYNAGDAKRTLELCKARQYDFIICDYNLGKGTDGLQLLEILQQNALLSEKTVVFVVTAEAARSVFYGFSEYEPDGYLIKPVKIHQIATRLMKAYAQRQALIGIEKTYQEQGLMAAQQYALRYPQNSAIRLKQAELLARQHQLQEAKAACVSLVKENNNKAKLYFAQLLVEQEDHELAVQYLEKLIKLPEIRIQALQMKAQCYMSLKRFDKAAEIFAKASDLAPNNIERLLVQFNLAEVRQDYDELLELGDKISRKVVNSHWESVAIYATSLRAAFRKCQQGQASGPLLTLIVRQLRNIEQRFPSAEHKLHKRVLSAHLNILKGDIKGGFEELDSVEQALVMEAEKCAQNNQAAPTHFYLCLDQASAYLSGGQLEQSMQKLQHVLSMLSSEPTLAISEQLMVRTMLEQISERQEKALKLQHASENAVQRGANMDAAIYGLSAWQVKPYDCDIALNLLKVFTKAIPMNVPIAQLKTTISQVQTTLDLEREHVELPVWYRPALREVNRSFAAIAKG